MKNYFNKTILLGLSSCFLISGAAVTWAINYNSPSAVVSFVEDTEITLAIYGKFTGDPMLNPLDINVRTKDGVVSLIGQLETKNQRDEAIKQARETDGVHKVEAYELLVIESDQPMTDTWITSKVKAVLIKEKLFSKRDIASLHVETTNGKVYLSGEATKKDAEYAEKIVKQISGLKDKVVNQIKYT